MRPFVTVCHQTKNLLEQSVSYVCRNEAITYEWQLVKTHNKDHSISYRTAIILS